MGWIIYGQEIYIVFSFLLTIGAILYFSKADIALLFRGFSFAFCGKRIFLGMAFLLSFLLLSQLVFLLAQTPIGNPFVLLNQGFSIFLYQGNQLLFGSTASPLYQTSHYQTYVQNGTLFLQQLQALKFWDILALSLLFLVLNAYYGGAISRSIAVEISTGNIPSLKETRVFTRKRFSHYLFPILLVIGGFLFLFGTNTLMGFLSSFTNATLEAIGLDFKEIGYSLLALAFPLLLILSFVVTLLLFGGVFAFFFFPVSVSVEGGDFFDSFSRSFSYLFARPWHFFFYQLIALLYGLMIIIASALFLLVMLLLTFKACHLGFSFWNEDPFQKIFLDAMGNPDWSPHQILFTTILFLVQTAFLGFVLVYFYFAQTSIYLLIRKSYDLVDVHHIYFEEEQLHEFDVLKAGFVQSTPPQTPVSEQHQTATISTPTITLDTHSSTSSETPKIISEPLSISKENSKEEKIEEPKNPKIAEKVEVKKLLEPEKEVFTSPRTHTEVAQIDKKTPKAPPTASQKSYPKKPTGKKKKK